MAKSLVWMHDRSVGYGVTYEVSLKLSSDWNIDADFRLCFDNLDGFDFSDGLDLGSSVG